MEPKKLRKGRPSNKERGIPETGLLAVRVPLYQIDWVRDTAIKEEIRRGELVAELIEEAIERIKDERR